MTKSICVTVILLACSVSIGIAIVLNGVSMTGGRIGQAFYSMWTGPATDGTCPSAIGGPGASYEHGVVFTVDSPGFIHSIKVYRFEDPFDTGTRTANLWLNSDGSNLGTVVFVDDKAPGWHTQLFVPPIAVSAGVQYVASYGDTYGSFTFGFGGLATAMTAGPITFVASGDDNRGFGNARQDMIGVYPDTAYAGNYCVDIVFSEYE